MKHVEKKLLENNEKLLKSTLENRNGRNGRFEATSVVHLEDN